MTNYDIKGNLQDSFADEKVLYSYIRRHQTVKDRIMSLKTPGGQLTETDQATADVLCNFFSCLFTHEGDWAEDAVSPPSVDIELGITEEKRTLGI